MASTTGAALSPGDLAPSLAGFGGPGVGAGADPDPGEGPGVRASTDDGPPSGGKEEETRQTPGRPAHLVQTHLGFVVLDRPGGGESHAGSHSHLKRGVVLISESPVSSPVRPQRHGSAGSKHSQGGSSKRSRTSSGSKSGGQAARDLQAGGPEEGTAPDGVARSLTYGGMETEVEAGAVEPVPEAAPGRVLDLVGEACGDGVGAL